MLQKLRAEYSGQQPLSCWALGLKTGRQPRFQFLKNKTNTSLPVRKGKGASLALECWDCRRPPPLVKRAWKASLDHCLRLRLAAGTCSGDRKADAAWRAAPEPRHHQLAQQFICRMPNINRAEALIWFWEKSQMGLDGGQNYMETEHDTKLI